MQYAFRCYKSSSPGIFRARITRYATLDRAFGTFEENHYPPTTSAVNITIAVVPRGRTIVIGDPLSILSLSRRESSEFPPHRFLTYVHVTNTQDVPYQTAAIDTHPLLEQPYITARSLSRICIYASRIISQLSITSSRLFAGNNGSLLACCSLVPLFLLLLSPCLRDSVRSRSTLSSSRPLVLASPDHSRRHMCVSRDVTTHWQIDTRPMPLLGDIRVYISWKRNPMSKKSRAIEISLAFIYAAFSRFVSN